MNAAEDFYYPAVGALAHKISEWARTKGFWPELPPSLTAVEAAWIEGMRKSQKIALMHSEASEALEGIREGSDSKLEGFSAEEEETADLIIRALDYAAHYKLRIAEAIAAKMEKNCGRPWRHGKAF